jgi:uncharacterized RDD family membrane protein YckC
MAEELIVLGSPEWTDPWRYPEYYTGITAKRIVAYLMDLVIVFLLFGLCWWLVALLGLLTFGLAWTLFALPGVLVPLLYHSLLVAGPRAATLGMRMMGIKVASMTSDAQVEGGRPALIQAIILTVVFYGSVTVTCSLILLVALFNPRRRTLHDWLAGTVVINDVGRR